MSGDGSDNKGMAPEREAEDPLQFILRQQGELQAAMIALTVALQSAADRWAAAPPPPRPATPPIVSFGAADNNPFTPAYNDPVAHPQVPVVPPALRPSRHLFSRTSSESTSRLHPTLLTTLLTTLWTTPARPSCNPSTPISMETIASKGSASTCVPTRDPRTRLWPNLPWPQARATRRRCTTNHLGG
jgi:hypothetical protein